MNRSWIMQIYGLGMGFALWNTAASFSLCSMSVRFPLWWKRAWRRCYRLVIYDATRSRDEHFDVITWWDSAIRSSGNRPPVIAKRCRESEPGESRWADCAMQFLLLCVASVKIFLGRKRDVGYVEWPLTYPQFHFPGLGSKHFHARSSAL